jgi:hypothetical protein
MGTPPVAKTVQIILSLLALVVAVFVAHSPQEVTSNLSKWAEVFGVKNPPAWVFNPAVDHYVGFCLVVFAILVWLIPYAVKRTRKAFGIIYSSQLTKLTAYVFRLIEGFSTHTTGVIYRIKIRNNTKKTLEDVKVTSESLGQLGSLPERLSFSQTKEGTSTLDPKASVFVDWFFVPLPLAQPGTVMRESSPSVYGPLRVTVSAKDTRAVQRLFRVVPITMNLDPFKESLIL